MILEADLCRCGEETSFSPGAEGIIQEHFDLREVSWRVERYGVRNGVEEPHRLVCGSVRAFWRIGRVFPGAPGKDAPLFLYDGAGRFIGLAGGAS